MQNCYGLISALLQNSYVGTLTLSISEYNAFGDTVKEHGQSQREVGSRVERGDGWGRGEWWGENGDNCSWTAKKEKFKKERKEIIDTYVYINICVCVYIYIYINVYTTEYYSAIKEKIFRLKRGHWSGP